MKKYIFIFFTLGFLLTPIKTLAVGGISISYTGYPGPLFSVTKIVPGNTITKSLSITNIDGDKKLISFKLVQKPSSDLADVIFLTVKDRNSRIVFGPKNLAEIYNSNSSFPLSSASAGQSLNYDFIAYFDINAGNEYQEKTESFDLNLEFTSNGDTDELTDFGNGNNSSGGLSTDDSDTNSNEGDPDIILPELLNKVLGVMGVKINSSNLAGESPYYWWIIAFLLVTTFSVKIVYLVAKTYKK